MSSTGHRLREALLWSVEIVVLLVAFALLHLARNLHFHTQPPSPQWSRHLTAGLGSMNTPPGADTMLDESLFLGWAADQGTGYARVTPLGQIELTGTVPPLTPEAKVRSVSLARIPLTKEEAVDLFWIETLRTPTLVGAGLDGAGGVVWGPRPVLDGVRSYALARSRGPGAPPPRLVVGRDDEIRVYQLPAGAPPAPAGPALRWPELYYVDGQVDRSGQLHLVVTGKNETGSVTLSYLTQGADGAWGEPVTVAQFRVSDRQTLRCPRLGLDLERAHVFYSLEDTRPVTGKAVMYYLSFPLEAPAPAQPQKLALFTDLLGAPSETVNDACPSPGQADSLELAVTSIVGRTRLRRYQEVVTLRFEGGAAGPPAAACCTRGASLSPILAPTPDGSDQYLAWLDTAGFRNYRVTVASTSEAFSRQLNRMTARDWLGAFLDTLVNLGLALPLTFVACFWLTVPFVVVGAGHFFALGWAERRPWPLALFAIGLHVLGKGYYVHRSFYGSPLTTVAMPVWMKSGPVVYLIPLALAAVAGFNLWRYSRLHPPRSPIGAYGRFAAVDTALTLVLYSPFILT
ncbi:MAG: hypothetical protein K6T75_02430 [Acetobacteraceae bacterium]|nr:hypothetical protein [Acetobacteraceae bacterium]